MNIAITAADSTVDSTVFRELAQTPYLLIVDFDTMDCTPITHVCSAGSDVELAHTVLKYRCEAIITGELSEQAFNVLADEGVTRYLAEDMSVRAALQAMDRAELELIRNADGSTTCDGDHHDQPEDGLNFLSNFPQ